MRFESKITIGFLFSMALLLGMGWSAFRTNRSFIESNRDEVRAQTYLKELVTTRSLVESAESGMRGYAISGDDKFLEQYQRSTSRILEQLEYLDGITPEGSPQELQLRQLNRMVEEKLAFTSGVVQMVRNGDLKGAGDTIATAYGKKLMDDIRDLIVGIQSGQNTLFEQSEQASIARSRKAIFNRLAMTLLSMLLLAGGYALIMGDIAKRRRIEADLIRARDDLRRLARRQESVRESERQRLSRELHDGLGQTLTMMRIQASLMEGRRATKRDIGRLKATAESAMDIVKRLSLDLRPPMLDDLGVAAAAEWLVKDFCGRVGLRHRLTVKPENLEPPAETGAAIFRILQEALTNAARHSRAGLVTVGLYGVGGGYRLTVKDDGRGFDPPSKADDSSLGIMGMRERAAACGGTLMIDSHPGRGTTIEALIPAPGKGDA